MSTKARVYIAFIIALGASALAQGLSGWNPHDVVRFSCYLALAVPASCLKVRLPGITGTMSVLFVFLLAGMADLGLAETLLIGAICAVTQSLWNTKVRPRLVQVAFSAANISSAVWVAYFVFIKLSLIGSFLQPPFRLMIAASVFFAVNTLPVAIVVALTERKSFRQVWSNCYFWSFSYYLVGAAIVGVFSFANRKFDWQVSLLILPVVYVIYRSYNLYLNQLQSERTHVAEVAVLHSRTQEALESSIAANTKLAAVIQASPLAILSLDRNANVTSWNARAERILGWSAEEVIGRPLPFSLGRWSEPIVDIIVRALGGELISGIEIRQWRKDGSPFDAAIWTAPLQSPGETVSGILITVADISDHRRLEEQLRLSQKLEAVGRLAGGIAHDFNNLLTVINGYSAMLVETLKADSYAAGQASDILASGTRAAELVAQLLAFSRRQMVKPRPIEVNQLVRDVERMLGRIIGEHIEFRTQLEPESGWILADVNQMEGVLLNLATNARDAMPEGGVLSVETGRVDIAGGEHSEHADVPPGSYVRMIVWDTGYGMDAETQEHVFEPFFTTKQTGKGTGLGLSSVYGGVAQSGGHIFVTSKVGRGTTFSIYLPRIERPNASGAPNVVSHPAHNGSETILLVEDEGGVRRMLREALNRAGYRILEAGNGAEALGQFRNELDQIDLLVTDIVMPVMNGLRLAQELRNRRPDLKVVFMSGHSDEVISNQSGTDPAPDLLHKPFLPAVLVRKVREVLDQSSERVRSLGPRSMKAV